MTPRQQQEKIFPKEYAKTLLSIAEGDWKTAETLYGDPSVRIENLFFHAEQAIEKSIKAVLCHLGVAVPLVHDLSALVAKFPSGMALPFGYELSELNKFATSRRYEEGDVPLSEGEASKVLQLSLSILDWAKAEIKK